MRYLHCSYQISPTRLHSFTHPVILNEMTTGNDVARARRDGMMLGIPLGELGIFATLLMSFAAGFVAFFATTFVAILAMLVYMTASGKTPDFSYTYKHFGLPVGMVVLALALGYLGTLWAKRKLRKA